MIGRLFGRWTVIRSIPSGDARKSRFLCRCRCGTEKVVWSTNLLRGLSKSCGCIVVEMMTIHGACAGRKRTAEFKTWKYMIDRCRPGFIGHGDYHDRGISVCARWRKFSNFRADMGRRPPGLTLDRIDNGRGYSKDNCRWATMSQQANNKRTTTAVTAFGETKSAKEWAEDPRASVSYVALYARLKYGWPAESAITKPSLRKNPAPSYALRVSLAGGE